MNFKAAVKFFGNRKNNVNLEELYSECPKVVIDNKELIVTLGQWLGKLPDAVKSATKGMSIISSISAKELMDKKKISDIEIKNINMGFANILKMAGISKDNTCVLRNFDESNLTFTCEFSETGEVAEMRINFGHWMDALPTLTIDFDGIKEVHEYISGDENRGDLLTLQSVTKKIDEEKKFNHFVSEFYYYGNVYDKENRLEIKIKYPACLTYGRKTNPYIDKELMETLLSEITFPVEINDICNRIEQCLKVPIEDYENISIIAKKKVGEKDVILTEFVAIKGKFSKLSVTKNDKKITVNETGAWSYESPQYSVLKTENNSVSYGFKSMAVDEAEKLPTPRELYGQVTPEIEEVKTLSKKLLQQNKTTN